MTKKDPRSKGSKVPAKTRIKPKELGPEEVSKLTGGVYTTPKTAHPVAGYSCPKDCESLTVIMPTAPSELTVKL